MSLPLSVKSFSEYAQLHNTVPFPQSVPAAIPTNPLGQPMHQPLITQPLIIPQPVQPVMQQPQHQQVIAQPPNQPQAIQPVMQAIPKPTEQQAQVHLPHLFLGGLTTPLSNHPVAYAQSRMQTWLAMNDTEQPGSSNDVVNSYAHPIHRMLQQQKQSSQSDSPINLSP